MSETKRSPEREEQRPRSVGEGNPDLGSNRNAGRVHELDRPESIRYQVVEAHGVSDAGYTED